MNEYEVIIHHNEGGEENITRFGYSPDHVLDELNEEFKHGSFTVIPPLPAHQYIAVMVYTQQGQKAFSLDELNISADDYGERRELAEVVKQKLNDKAIFDDYDFFHLIN